MRTLDIQQQSLPSPLVYSKNIFWVTTDQIIIIMQMRCMGFYETGICLLVTRRYLPQKNVLRL